MAKSIFKLFLLLSSFFTLGAADCAPTTACNKKCGKNQIYSECGNNACQNTCANPSNALVCKAGCVPGCICAEGYLKNSKGVCVLPKDCDCRGPNEIFSECGNHGCLNTCKEPDLLARCSYLPGCYPGCICKEKFLRDENGVCVPQKQCYKCKQNEIFSDCDANGCENTCADPEFASKCDPFPGCSPGCKCLPGFLRNDVGDCVLPHECKKSTPTCTGRHEVYSECGNNSCQKNCDTIGKNVACKPICTPGCICEEGYIRNKSGVCVTPDQCENKCTGKNEAYTECVCPCCESCATLGQDITCNFLVCNPGCDCKPGFFRNSKRECVPPEECDCKENEELDLCFNPCPPQTCSAIGKVFKCAAACKPACKCKFNYRRDADGICVPIQECPALTCNGKNEVYNSCPPDCLDQRCQSLYETILCTLSIKECQPQCVCKDDFLRNQNGVCIPDTQCPCPDANAEVVSCPNPCPGGTCEQPEFSPCKAPCKKRGCQCKKGYVKDDKGKCILLAECVKKCSGKNEEYNSCGTACPLTCENKDQNIACIESCVPGCFCKEGFVRKNGQCVKPEECQCGPFEVYSSCAPTLQEICKPSGKPSCQSCKPGCVCIAGYERECVNGKCVKKTNCKT